MAQTHRDTMTMLSTTTITRYERVVVTSASTSPPSIGRAGAGTASIGWADRDAVSGDYVTIHLAHPTTLLCEMSSSCSVGDTLYAASNGKVSTTSSGTAIGVALEVSTGSGSVIEYGKNL